MIDVFLDDDFDEQDDGRTTSGLKDTFVIPMRIRRFHLACEAIVFSQEESVHHRDLGRGVCTVAAKREKPCEYLRVGHIVEPKG